MELCGKLDVAIPLLLQ